MANDLLPLIPLVVFVPAIAFWLWMYRDMTNNRYLTSNSRYYWTLAFIFMNIFGAVWYYVVEYRSRF